MFGIGDFASYGRVSVRMLRHYDAIGLMPPAYVDPATGYRTYDAGQLSRLNRIVALKDLGFTLEPVIQPLYERLVAALGRAHVTPTGPDVAYYEDAPDGDQVVVHAAVPVNAVASDAYEFAIVDLPTIEQAATVVH